MSATVIRGACAKQPGKVRFRNRVQARKGLDRGRQACRAHGIPAPLWPAEVYRCDIEHGCGGWHLASDRWAVREFFATNPHYNADMPPHLGAVA